MFDKPFGDGLDVEEEKEEKNGKEEEDNDEEEMYESSSEEGHDEEDEGGKHDCSSEDEGAFKLGDKVVGKFGSRQNSTWYDGVIISGKLKGTYRLRCCAIFSIILSLTFQFLLRQ